MMMSLMRIFNYYLHVPSYKVSTSIRSKYLFRFVNEDTPLVYSHGASFDVDYPLYYRAVQTDPSHDVLTCTFPDQSDATTLTDNIFAVRHVHNYVGQVTVGAVSGSFYSRSNSARLVIIGITPMSYR